MSPEMKTCMNMFQAGSAFFEQGIATLDEESARRQVAGDVNPILWLAGHLLDSRKYLLDLLGGEQEMPFGDTFRSKYDAAKEYPSLAAIKSKWEAISGQLFEKLESADDARFEESIDWNLPIGDKTVRGALLFYTYHEGYHMGQISYARRAMGMDGLVPY